MNTTLRLSVLGLCLLAFMAYAAGTVTAFTCTYQGADVKLEWRIDDESSLEGFEVARKRPDETSFTRLGMVPANGTGLYTFVDDQLYKSAQVNTISYRLTAKNGAGTTAYFSSIAHNPTAVQRTWGSIKSMFK